jgi:monoamine oxidase
VRYFGDEARNYLEYSEKLWNNEKFAGGCPTVSVGSSGVMRDFARATREPFLNVHFCGTESATVWMGYMDGAVESGERAANEVLYKLFKGKESIKIEYEKTYYYQEKQELPKKSKK